MATIEKMIDKKLNEKIPVSLLNETKPTQEQSETYAEKVLRVPDELRKIIKETKNDEKVEESEQAKRAKNLIIHGAEEYGEDTESVNNIDKEYIDDILKHLGLALKPDSVTRIGNPKKSNSRPIKVCMKSKEDRQAVMTRLYRLKDTEHEFGKISITEDYMQTERNMIKNWNAKAKDKSTEDNEYIYKVRGDPKNGLKIIRFKRRE